MPRATLLIPLSLILVVASAAAEPPELRRVALILEPARKADAARVGQLTDLLVNAFDKRKFERARLIAAYDPNALAEGRRLLADVRKDLAGDHSLQRATAHEGKLVSALLHFKAALGTVGPEELVEVYEGLASTRLKDGDAALAAQYMTAVINMKPTVGERDFFGRGELKDLYRQVAATAHLRKTFSLRVDSRPSGAEVYVGDKLAGYTPITLDNLKTGTHLVRVRRDGFYSHGWLADTTPGTTMTLRHELRPIAGRARFQKWVSMLQDRRMWKREPEKAKEAVAGLRRILRATDVVVARVKRTKNAYTLDGAVGAKAKEPRRLELEVPVDAELLKRVNVLTYEWAP